MIGRVRRAGKPPVSSLIPPPRTNTLPAMIAPRYRHVIWDWNGTLLDDVHLSIDIMNALLSRRSLPRLDLERYHRLFDFPVRRYYEQLGFDAAVDSFEQLSVEFINAYDDRRYECRLHAGAERVLEAVKHAGCSQSILSAYRQHTLEEIVAHFGLSFRFERLTGLADIYAHSKIEAGKRWLDELGLPPASVLLVGDTLHDFEVAAALGVDCALVCGGHHPEDRLRQKSPHVFSDLVEFAAARSFSEPTTAPATVPPAGLAGPESPVGSA